MFYQKRGSLTEWLLKKIIGGIFGLVFAVIIFKMSPASGMLGSMGIHFDSIGDVFALIRQAQDGIRMINDLQGQLGDMNSLMSGLGN